MTTSMSYLNAYRNARVLVTGGYGAIGTNLCRRLAALGASVTILDDLSSPSFDSKGLAAEPRCRFIRGNILDTEAMTKAFSPKPDLVFHLAALFANQNSVDHPEQDLMVNGLGTLRVLQAAQTAGVDRLVYAATSCAVYGDISKMPITEESLSLDLHTPYQVSKLLGEMYCNYFRSYHQLKTVRVRFFNSYGPGDMPGKYRNVIPNFIVSALRKEPLIITGTGEETRDWTFVEDIVDGLIRGGAAEAAPGHVFNIASGRETRIKDVATWVNEITENPAGIQYVPRRNWDTHSRRWASIEKAKEMLGYEPKTELRSGLVKTVKWFRTNWAGILAKAEPGAVVEPSAEIVHVSAR